MSDSNNVALYVYLNNKGILTNMRECCENYLNNLNHNTILKFPPLRFLLKLDVMGLYEDVPQLGDILLKEPTKFNKMCNEIFFVCLRSLDSDYKQFVQSSQLAVTIRLTSLPRVLSRSPYRQPRYENIVTFNGILLSISKPTSDVFHTVWSCPEGCDGNEIIHHYIPKTSPKCAICKSLMFENCGLRCCGEKVTAIFKIKNSLLPKKFIVTDDLIELLQLGSTYNIHAVALKQTFSVWSLEEHVALLAPQTFSSPPEIDELFTACDKVPWKFIYCLASTIGLHVCPLKLFMPIKINLLLSLASVKAHLYTGSAIVNFLGVGFDTGYVADLMKQAATLASNHEFLGTSNNSIEMVLTAASAGICVMPLPLQTYGRKQINSLLSSLESGAIIHEVGKAKLSCAVWAQGMDFKKFQIYNIGNVFGLISRGDTKEYDSDLVDFKLRRSVQPEERSNEEIEALKDLFNYIELVAGYRIDISEETENLLKRYFLTARKVKPESVTVASMNALIAVSVTSARLCRRNITNDQDAFFAIWLHVVGSQDPRLAPDEYLQPQSNTRKFDRQIQQFIDWLHSFLEFDLQ